MLRHFKGQVRLILKWALHLDNYWIYCGRLARCIVLKKGAKVDVLSDGLSLRERPISAEELKCLAKDQCVEEGL